MLKKTTIAAILAIAPMGTALAADPFQETDAAEDPHQKQIQEMLEYGTGPFLSGMTDEEKIEAVKVGQEVARDLMSAYTETLKKQPSIVQDAKSARQFADSIADETIQASRDKALEFIGIDPQSNNGLYVFVTWGMPLDMLRSYVLDAMWSGATVLFKGVPPDKTLGDFILKDLQSLVYGKSAAANISIDPRMFDAYNVTVAPTIVYTNTRGDLTCQGLDPVPFTYEGQQLQYNACVKLPEDSYWKMSGAVSMSYALDTFAEHRAPGVEVYRKALSKGFAEGKAPGKEQLAFTGRWKDVLSPEDAALAQSIANDAGKMKMIEDARNGEVAIQGKQGRIYKFKADKAEEFKRQLQEFK